MSFTARGRRSCFVAVLLLVLAVAVILAGMVRDVLRYATPKHLERSEVISRVGLDVPTGAVLLRADIEKHAGADLTAVFRMSPAEATDFGRSLPRDATRQPSAATLRAVLPAYPAWWHLDLGRVALVSLIRRSGHGDLWILIETPQNGQSVVYLLQRGG